ncbi:MAG: hypoxanthine phosphoribosyltransferase [Desulfovibrionaceae bacterium]
MKAGELRSLFTPEEIQRRVREIAADVDALYGDEPLVVVCVLKGGFMFFSDLVRHLRGRQVEVDFVRLSSYGQGTSSSGHIAFTKDVEISLQDKHVLVVEDLVDSGLSMQFLLSTLAQRGAKSLRLAILLDKHERRRVEVRADFIGFHLQGGFIVGYGIDCAERYRNLPGIYELVAE